MVWFTLPSRKSRSVTSVSLRPHAGYSVISYMHWHILVGDKLARTIAIAGCEGSRIEYVSFD